MLSLTFLWIAVTALAGFYWYGMWGLLYFYNRLEEDAYLIYAQWGTFFLNAIFAWRIPLVVTTGMMMLVLISDIEGPEGPRTFALDRTLFYAFMFGIAVLPIWIRTKIPWRLRLGRKREPDSRKIDEDQV